MDHLFSTANMGGIAPAASAYRELNVYIDGCLAAAFYPALVVRVDASDSRPTS